MQQKILQQAIDLSDQILFAIEHQDIEKISQLDKKRKVVIERYYQTTKPIDAELTLLLKQKNDQIVFQLVELQQQTQTQQIGLNKSKKFIKAYQGNT